MATPTWYSWTAQSQVAMQHNHVINCKRYLNHCLFQVRKKPIAMPNCQALLIWAKQTVVHEKRGKKQTVLKISCSGLFKSEFSVKLADWQLFSLSFNATAHFCTSRISMVFPFASVLGHLDWTDFSHVYHHLAVAYSATTCLFTCKLVLEKFEISSYHYDS